MRGGAGFELKEVASETPLEVPWYRYWEGQKDEKLAGKDGWAYLWLDVYRLTQGELDSDFFLLYIPQPPALPLMEPPTDMGWLPFPYAGQEQRRGQNSGGGGGDGAGASPVSVPGAAEGLGGFRERSLASDGSDRPSAAS